MAASKITEILGTKGLSSCDSIRVYNSSTFKKESIAKEGLGLTDGELSILLQTPTVENIREINSILERHLEYFIVPNVGGQFTFNNDRLNVINGEGFDTIIFLSYSEVLGFMVLVNPVGVNQDYSNRTSYDLKRTYKLKKVTLTLSSTGDEIRVDQDTIQLLGDAKTNAETVGRNLSGKENYNYATVRDLGSIGTLSNYTIHLGEALTSTRAKNIFTDTTISRIKGNEFSMAKLDIKKNLTLDVAYTNFPHHQIGYYRGDPSLFVWNDDAQYSIFSLTTTLGELFGESNDRPYSYTVNDKVSNTEMFQVPILHEEYGRPTIEYFSGKYVVVKSGTSRYLLDIDRQDGELDQSLGSLNRGWLKYKDPDDGELYLQTNFVVDRLCPRNRVWQGTWSWQRWNEAVGDVNFLSDTYIDSNVAIIGNNKTVIGKIGSWIILEDAESKVYSSMGKSLTMALEEPDPIVINDQSLLCVEENEEENSVTYTLYNGQGYYITDMARVRLGITADNESREVPYKSSSDIVTFKTTSTYSSPASSPLELHRSFFGNYRRNVLPSTMDGFKIIGAFHGLIFYRIGNTVNYL